MSGQLQMFSNWSSDAVLSDCRTWRYWLRRQWDIGGKGACVFIGLNPSTADETNNDPTITRCINYAKDWGYSSLIMLNLFAFRATFPADMRSADDPVGPENDEWILKTCTQSDLVVCAWGAHGSFRKRASEVYYLLCDHDVNLHCLDCTKDGEPKHPLYLRKDLRPSVYLGNCEPFMEET